MYRHVFSVLLNMYLGVWFMNFEICLVNKLLHCVDFSHHSSCNVVYWLPQ
jgi:hypothetical protein